MTAAGSRGAPQRTYHTPGWLSRSPIQIAHSAREPRLYPALRSLSQTRPFESRRFAGVRPLALLRMAALREFSVAHWGAPPGLIHPWHLAPRVDTWFGIASRPHEFRARRRQPAPEEREPGRMPSIQRRAVGVPSEALETTALPAWLDEPVEAEAALAEAERGIWQSLLPLVAPFEPVSIPHDWFAAPAEEAGGAPTQPRTMPAAPMVLRRAVSAPAAQVAASPAARGMPSQPMAVGAHPEERQRASPSAEVSTQAAPAAIVRPQGAERDVVALREPGVVPERIGAHAPPQWAFALLTPELVSLVAEGVVAPTAESVAFSHARPETSVRRASRSELPQATETARFARIAAPMTVQRSLPQTSIADERIVQMLPVQAMLSQVPSVELGFERHAAAPVGILRTPAQRDVRASAMEESATAGEHILPSESPVVAPAARVRDTAEMPAAAQGESRIPAAVSSHSEASLGRLAGSWSMLESVLRRVATPPTVHEPAALQVLRRAPIARREETLARVASLPTLGSGEALPEAVRRPMETFVGRDLGAVRTFTSEAAEALGAEAFTTGERIVFAPGRMDLRSARGLALVAHELMHVGQPLAFREQGTPVASDAAEEAARRQEEQVLRVIEQGWPQAPRMELLSASRAIANLMDRAGASSPGGATQTEGGDGAGGEASTAANAPGGGAASSAPASSTEGLPTARLSEVPGGGGGTPSGQTPADEVMRLAQEVYKIVTERIRAERMRHFVD